MTALYARDYPRTNDMDISSLAFWGKDFNERDTTFKWLRDNDPVSWQPALEVPGLPRERHGQAGFWSVVKAEDVSYVSLNPELFSSAQGDLTSLRPTYGPDVLPPSFISMDPPTHTRYRRIMSAAFTPKATAKLVDQINERAKEIVERVIGAGEIDFVTEVSAKLPMLTIADLVGIPSSLKEEFALAGDMMVSAGDSDLRPEGVDALEFAVQNIGILRAITLEVAEQRRKKPAEDVMTALVQAEIDGHKLTDQELTGTMVLLSIAGNDTTKQTTTRTVMSFDQNPDQRAWLMEDFDGRIAQSVEEFVRHACPVIQFARTAMADTELRGVKITAGDKVGIWYCSGNRDETRFENPERFDLSRPKVPHVGFGGGGVHFCLGNSTAKAQLRALFSEILTKLPNLEVIGEPDLLFSDFIHGVKHLPVRV